MNQLNRGKIFPSKKDTIQQCHTLSKRSFFSDFSTFICFETSLTRCLKQFKLRKRKEEKNVFRITMCIGNVRRYVWERERACVRVLGSLHKLTIYVYMQKYILSRLEICSENQFVCKNSIYARSIGSNAINKTAKCSAESKVLFGGHNFFLLSFDALRHKNSILYILLSFSHCRGIHVPSCRTHDNLTSF